MASKKTKGARAKSRTTKTARTKSRATKATAAKSRKAPARVSKPKPKAASLTTVAGAGEPVPTDVPVAGAEPPATPPEPAPAAADTVEAQRARARAERRRQRELRKQAPAPKLPPAVAAVPEPKSPAPVVPIESARKPAPDNKEPIEVPLDEVLRWRIEALNARVDKAESAVRAPLLEQLKRIIEQKVAEALRANPECIKARQVQAECVNEIIHSVAPKLPPGYAVARVRPEHGDVLCEYRPEQAGKLFEVPKG